MSSWLVMLLVAVGSPPEETVGVPREAPRCPEATSELPPATDNPYKQRVADSPFRREGFVLGVIAGVSGCDTGDFCNGEGFWSRTIEAMGEQGRHDQRPGPGPSFAFEMGLRPIPYVEALAFGHFTYHPTRLRQPGFFPEGDPFTYSASGGLALMVRPLAFTRFDPFVGFGLGYHEYRSTVRYARSAGLEARMDERLVRLLLRPSVGLDVFVARNVALGPRFDYDLFVGGQYCNTIEVIDADGSILQGGGCNDISALDDLPDPEGDLATGTFPRFWRVGLNLRVYL
jgi:hypothetical protein